MHITNLEVRRDYVGSHHKMVTKLSAVIDGVPFHVCTEQSSFFGQNKEQEAEMCKHIMRDMVNKLGRTISEKLLEEHITQAALDITSNDPMTKELAKMALRAGL